MYQERKAFSMAETIITMGIISVLAMTMMSLNHFSNNKAQVAQTQLAQVDSAIRSWGKAITDSGETGVGAAATINSQEALVNSIQKYFKTNGMGARQGVKIANGTAFRNYDVIVLENGIKLNVQYTYGSTAGDIGIEGAVPVGNQSTSALALIVAEADEAAISEDYAVLPDKVAALGDIFEGFTRVSVEKVPGIKGTVSMVCLNPAICGSETKGCAGNPTACKTININNDSVANDGIYVKDTSEASSCGIGKTGTKSTITFADAYGTMYNIVEDQCCDFPQYFDETIGKCACIQNKMAFTKGEVFNPNSSTCSSIAPKGTYADGNGNMILCNVNTETGYFCNEEGLSAPKLCNAGYFCPDVTDKADVNKNAEYYNSTKGGLVNEIECPPGYVCNARGTKAAQKCPAGHYCPGGTSPAIACPEGTQGPADEHTSSSESVCKSCPDGTYQPAKGQGACVECKSPKFTDKATGATQCLSCGEGTYFDATTRECKACPVGYYCPDGTLTPAKCPDNSSTGGKTNAKSITDCKCDAGYATDEQCSAQSDTLICTEVGIGFYSPAGSNCKYACSSARQNSTTTGTKSASIDACLCNKGFKLSNSSCVACEAGTYNNTIGNNTSCNACNSGKYQDETAQTSCKTCAAGSYSPASGKISACTACAAGTYQNETGKTSCKACNSGKYQDTKGQAACKTCAAGSYSPTSGNITACTACAAGSYQNEAGKTSCKQCDCGHYSVTSGQTSCTACGDNQYAPKGSSRCYDVPAGRRELSNDKCGYSCKPCPVVEGSYTLRYDSNAAIKKNVIFRASTTLNPSTCECNCPRTVTCSTSNGCNQVGFHTGASGIMYHSSSSQWHSYNADVEVTMTGGDVTCPAVWLEVGSPLVLDLKHNGLKFTSIEDGVFFDLDGDGVVDKIAWTTEQTEFDDAFLVLDKNGNGQIDSGKELFGDQNGEVSGFEELAKYDDNNDNKITPEDKAYNEIKLWCDMNKNGKVDDGELRGLSDERVTEISTKYQTKYDENGNILTDENGNIIGYIGQFTHIVETITDGISTLIEKIGDLIDVFFQMISGAGE